MHRCATGVLVLTAALAACARPAVRPTKIELQVVRPSIDGRSLSWSPKGAKAAYGPELPSAVRTAAVAAVGSLPDAVFGKVQVGPDIGKPIPFVVCRVSEARTFRERLLFDGDRDGRFDRVTEVHDTAAKDIRGRTWVTWKGVSVTVPFADATVIHELDFWLVYPKLDEPGEFNGVRFTRNSWLEGTALLGGVPLRVALIDADNDLMPTSDDVWVAVPTGDGEMDAIGSPQAAARLDEPVFVGELALRIERVSVSGSSMRIRLSDDVAPTPTPVPTARPRAAEPVTWFHDLDEAKRQASTAGARVLVDWRAEWCGPCKEMERDTFPDAAVTTLLREGYVCVALDKDEQYRLAETMAVEALPTVIILEPGGAEARRHIGMLSAPEMESWLRGEAPTQ